MLRGSIHNRRKEMRKERNTNTTNNLLIFLILQNMNLFLNCGKKLVESFSLISNDLQRMIYKDDTMAFVFRQGVKYIGIIFKFENSY